MMNYKLLLETALLAGEILLRSGAETYRVEDTMQHILKTSKVEQIDALALMTGITVTLNDSELEQPISMIRTIDSRSTNMNNIIKVNGISRNYCAGKITLQEANEQLKCVKEKLYSRTQFNIATVLVGTGFAMMFGGTFLDVLFATIMGIWLAGCITFAKIKKIDTLVQDVVSCAGIALFTILVQAYFFPQLDVDIVIVSAFMPIVPGVAITNAIRDTLQGDYLSGCARMLEAFLKAASVAVGAGLGMAIGGMIL